MGSLLTASLVGIGGTVALDIWAVLLAHIFSVPGVNWPMVGRWIGNMLSGRFAHESMAAARPVAGETAIGWGAHYIIGIGYGLLVFAIFGVPWLEHPTLLSPLIVSWVLLIAPYFIMMPGMGSGIAGSKTLRPAVTRLKSVVGHSVFGFGMYGTAEMLAAL